MRDPQTPLSNRSCISTFKQHWHQAGQILFMNLIFPVITPGTSAKCHVTSFTAKKRGLRALCPSVMPLLSPNEKKLKNITKPRPLPEGHTRFAQYADKSF